MKKYIKSSAQQRAYNDKDMRALQDSIKKLVSVMGELDDATFAEVEFRVGDLYDTLLDALYNLYPGEDLRAED